LGMDRATLEARLMLAEEKVRRGEEQLAQLQAAIEFLCADRPLRRAEGTARGPEREPRAAHPQPGLAADETLSAQGGTARGPEDESGAAYPQAEPAADEILAAQNRSPLSARRSTASAPRTTPPKAFRGRMRGTVLARQRTRAPEPSPAAADNFTPAPPWRGRRILIAWLVRLRYRARRAFLDRQP
jgi:hypothetical protein